MVPWSLPPMSPMPSRTEYSPVRVTAASGIRQGKAPSPCVTRMAWMFGIASFVAVGCGCLLANSAGIQTGVWARNAAAWVIGAVLARLVACFRPTTSLSAVLLLLAAVSLLLSLFSSGQAGVHRWIALGPLTWNVAFVWLPAAAVALAAAARSGSRWAWWAALVIEAELWLQPDASQATAFAAASIFTLLTTQTRGPAYLGASVFLALIAALAWTRPDPLTPVPEVEGILQLAVAHSGSMAALCVTSLAGAAAAPLLARDRARSEGYPSAIALAVYFLVCSLMPLFGAFPVPLAGMGMSPIIGFWLGIGALMRVCGSAPLVPTRATVGP